MTEANNSDRRTLAEWLRDITGANPDILGPFYPGDMVSPNERMYDNDSPEDSAAPLLTPQDLQKMGRSDEQAEQFHRLLRANSEKPAGEGYEELLGLAETVGWLHTKQCLPALRSVLKTVVKRDVQERPALVEALANQLAMFPPQEGDYEEPTDDQVSALEALLQTMSNHPDPGQFSGVLPSVREALGAACGGIDWHMGFLSLEDAVAKAKPEKGMAPFLRRLDTLQSPAEPAEPLPEVVGGEPPSRSKNDADEDATTGDPSLTP
jgi:hypothetical protein